MSHWDYLQDAAAAVVLLRRLDNGDESAYKEIEPLLKCIDARDTKHRAERERLEQQRAKRTKTGRKNSGAFQIAPAHEAGVDYGATGLILIAKPGARLVWRSGSKYFSGIGSQAYTPADLEIMFAPDNSCNRWTVECLTDNHEQELAGKRPGVCRLTKGLVLQYRQRIDAVFGSGTAEQAAGLKATIVMPLAPLGGRLTYKSLGSK